MRLTTNLTGALLMAGLAAYAWSPCAVAQPTTSPAFAVQQDQTAPPKPDQQKPEKPAKPAKPAKAKKTAKPAKESKTAKTDQADHDQNAQPNNADRDQHAQQPDNADRHQQNDKAQPDRAQNGHDQGGGAHGRISDNDYKAHFGHDHHFAVRSVVTTTRIVPNQTQFVYSGYTFVFLDPWPPEWAWTDDCYIDYEDGEYVLIDLNHPGMTIALEIAG